MASVTSSAVFGAASSGGCLRHGALRNSSVRSSVVVRAFRPIRTPSVVSGRGAVNLAVRAAYSPDGVTSEAERRPTEVFGQLERLVEDTVRARDDLPGSRSDWEEVEGCWVLRPPSSKGKPQALVHFIGGGFVGTAPQLFYRLFLETLALRNIMVICTPYETNFDHLRIADETQFKFDCAYRALAAETSGLPIYGVGHSLGSLIHLLICTRYTVNRAGNALMSFNNRPATETIPLLSPLIAPGAKILFPVMQQLVASPIRQPVEKAADVLKGISPSIVKQLVPLFEQAGPLFMDVASGRQEFTPSPFETQNLIRSYYAVPRNLLLRFQFDSMDESTELAQVLQSSSAVGSMLDLSMRSLAGDHNRPLHQNVVDLPPEISRAARAGIKEGSGVLKRVSTMARDAGVPEEFNTGLNDIANVITEGSSILGGNVGGPITDEVQALGDEIAAWMGVGDVVPTPPKYLPGVMPTPRMP